MMNTYKSGTGDIAKLGDFVRVVNVATEINGTEGYVSGWASYEVAIVIPTSPMKDPMRKAFCMPIVCLEQISESKDWRSTSTKTESGYNG